MYHSTSYVCSHTLSVMASRNEYNLDARLALIGGKRKRGGQAKITKALEMQATFK